MIWWKHACPLKLDRGKVTFVAASTCIYRHSCISVELWGVPKCAAMFAGRLVKELHLRRREEGKGTWGA